MPIGWNNVDNKLDDQLLIMQATTESNGQDYDEKMKMLTEDLTAIITSMMDQIKNSKYSPYKKYLPKAQDPTTVFPAKKGLYHWKVDIIRKLVVCGLPNT